MVEWRPAPIPVIQHMGVNRLREIAGRVHQTHITESYKRMQTRIRERITAVKITELVGKSGEYGFTLDRHKWGRIRNKFVGEKSGPTATDVELAAMVVGIDKNLHEERSKKRHALYHHILPLVRDSYVTQDREAPALGTGRDWFLQLDEISRKLGLPEWDHFDAPQQFTRFVDHVVAEEGVPRLGCFYWSHWVVARAYLPHWCHELRRRESDVGVDTDDLAGSILLIENLFTAFQNSCGELGIQPNTALSQTQGKKLLGRLSRELELFEEYAEAIGLPAPGGRTDSFVCQALLNQIGLSIHDLQGANGNMGVLLWKSPLTRPTIDSLYRRT